MYSSEGNPAVELERNNMLLASPVLAVTFGGWLEPGLSILALRTLSLPRICAVATVDVGAVAALQNPNPGVVIGAMLRG